ncbi:Gfo/Idh/MocA family protein [Aerococcus tenax]|uniref:Gfo/Idh/MocA family protein n=1 Tax=Aerococcus tenax TaxID=3078812 RepID=UPI0018A73E2F|nr:Gfo/Idh/MocA family oxidoreductase [Aerococcus tenax]
MSKKIKLGVVGAGIYGSYHIQTYQSLDEVEHLVICDFDESKTAKFNEKYGIKGYNSIESMLENEKLDAVAIVTPDPYHYEPIMEVISSGIKHIFVEKPITTNTSEALEIQQLAEEKGVNIYIDFHKRWDPSYNVIKNAVDNDNEDEYVRGYMSVDDIINVPEKWFSWADKSSPTWFVGIHCVDLIRYLTNSEVEQVFAQGTKEVLKERGTDSYDSISALLTMEDGSHWTIENSWILPNSFPKSNDGQLVVLTKKQYFKNESYRGIKTYNREKIGIPNYIFMDFSTDKPTGFGLQPMKDFVHTVSDNSKIRVNLKDGVMATAVCEAIHDSCRQNQVINMKEYIDSKRK